MAVVLAPVGDGAVRRRGSDVFRIVTAVLVVVAVWLFLLVGAGFEKSVVSFVSPPPEAIRWLVTTVLIAGSIGAIVAAALIALLSRRVAMIRDVAVAAAGSLALAYLLETQLGPGNGRLGQLLAHVDIRIPLPRVAVAVAILLAAAPYLSRGLRRTVQVVIFTEALATVVDGSGLVTSVVASVALGWGVAAVVALGFGSPLGIPSSDDVKGLLGEMQLPGYEVRPALRQDWGVARYIASNQDSTLWVSVYGRDAYDAHVASKAVRFVLYRDSGPSLALTRLQQVEHEAYLTLRAGMAGTSVPALVTTARVGPRRDAVLVLRSPSGDPLTDIVARDGNEGDVAAALDDHALVSGDALKSVFAELSHLQGARLAHRSIGPSSILLDGECATFTDFRLATTDATERQTSRDTACTIAALALVADPASVVAAARDTVGDDALVASLPFLQRGALSSELSRIYRKKQPLLDEIRKDAAAVLDVPVPELVEAKRISWATLAVIAGSLIGGWSLIGVLVNVGKSFDAIAGADWGWVLASFLFAASAVPCLALEVTGAVTAPLPYARVVALEMAHAFVGLAGGTVAVMATRMRFFQQEGYDATLALSSGVLITTVSWITKGAFFVLAIPFAGHAVHLATSTSGSGAGLVRLLVIIVLLAAVVIGAILFIPRLRRLAADKIRPRYDDVRKQFRELVAQPRKFAQIFGGAILAQASTLLSLTCAIRALGGHVPFATLIVITTLAGIVGGASPAPGGIGVAEAGLIFGLSSVALSEADAVGAVFIQRLFTTYLPPLAGWPVLVTLRRRGYV